MNVWYFVNYYDEGSTYSIDEIHEISQAYYKQRTFTNRVSMSYNTLRLGVL